MSIEENSNGVKKAIIPIAGLGTRFLPLSLVISKEFFPLVDKPIVQYIIEEAKSSGISEIIFVINPKQKMILNYFKKYPDIEKILVKRKKEKQVKIRLPFLLETMWCIQMSRRCCS